MFGFRKVGSCAIVTALAGVYLSAAPAGGGTPFVSTWRTFITTPGSSPADTVHLPLYDGGTYSFTVDYGDSSPVATVSSWDDEDATHQYATSGSYTIRIAGILNGWSFGNSGDREKITDISDWGTLQLGNKGGAFQGATNLQVSAAGAPDLTGVTNLSHTFDGATSFNTDVSGWDTRAVTDMSGMFMDAMSFDQDVNGWNTGQVTDMHSMFERATNFSWYMVDWNTSNVTDMSRMFAGASSFTDDLEPWDVSKVTDMHGMFDAATLFDGKLTAWDVSGVTDMSRMFAEATSFNQSVGEWSTGNVTTMAGMFDNATSFAQDLSLLNTAKVTDMSRMFAGATSFGGDLDAWDVGEVRDMQSMFEGATSFNGKLTPWDVSGVTDMSRMFAGATSFNQSVGEWSTGNVTTMAGMFDNATSFAQDLSLLNTAKVTDMSRMFAGATSFNQNLGGWNVQPVTTMADMFTGSGLASDTYSDTLIGWSAQPGLKKGVHLAASTTYTCKAEDAHTILTRTFDWVISDGGVPSCMELPSAVEFPEAQVMTTLGPTQTVTLRNTGYEPLILLSESLSEPARDFSIVSNACGERQLPKGQECMITIRFTPQGTGRRTNALNIAYGGVLRTRRIALTGTGVRDGLIVAPSSLDFGKVPMGHTKDLTIRITARIDGALTATSLLISGQDRSSFSLTDHLRCAGMLISKDAFCQFTVTFKPESEGTETAELVLGNGSSVPLNGVGGKDSLQPQAVLDGDPPIQVPLDGIVVITPPHTTTTIGQPILTTVTGGPLDQTIAAKKKYFRVIRGKHGKVSLRTYGYKHLRLVITQKAKATSTYKKYVRKAVYINGERKSLKVRS